MRSMPRIPKIDRKSNQIRKMLRTTHDWCASAARGSWLHRRERSVRTAGSVMFMVLCECPSRLCPRQDEDNPSSDPPNPLIEPRPALGRPPAQDKTERKHEYTRHKSAEYRGTQDHHMRSPCCLRPDAEMCGVPPCDFERETLAPGGRVIEKFPETQSPA